MLSVFSLQRSNRIESVDQNAGGVTRPRFMEPVILLMSGLSFYFKMSWLRYVVQLNTRTADSGRHLRFSKVMSLYGLLRFLFLSAPPLDPSFQHQLFQYLQQLDVHNRRRFRRVITSVDATSCLVDGRRCVNFAANDYLALSYNPEVLGAFQQEALQQAGAGASALVAGYSQRHADLEWQLAQFEQTEAALLFPSGFAANVGTIGTLVTTHDAVFCDRENHASIIDGCRAAPGKMFVYRRDQLDRLADSMAGRRTDYERLFIVTDTVFSMDGTIAPLKELCSIANDHNAVLIVDEAHGTGIFGVHGGGVCQHLGVEEQVQVKIGTLSKAVGAMGGFVAGDQALADWLWNTARSQFFSTALPPAVCAAATQALQIIRDDSQRRERLHHRSRFARERLADFGLISVEGSHGPIVPIVVGDDALVVHISEKLQSNGFFIPAIRPPTVSRGTARLRMSINCEHTESQIEEAISQISKALHNAGA